MNGMEYAPTALQRWKDLAEVENRRARQNWGRSGGTYTRPEVFGDPEENAARARRDAQIEAWALAGISVREISARTGLVQSSINRILRIRRLEARAGSRTDGSRHTFANLTP